MTASKPRGFAALSPARMRQIASDGGRTAHAAGWAHEFTSKEASAAGKIGAAVRAAPWWASSCGRIELRIILRDAKGCSHSGSCDADVLELSRRPYIARQLARVNPQYLHLMLREYGAWDDAELSDHAANLQRLLWLACCDLSEDAP